MVNDTQVNGIASEKLLPMTDLLYSSAAAINCLVDEFVSKCALQEYAVDSHGYDKPCGCVWPVPSLVQSDSLNDEDLKVPVVTAPFLEVDLGDEIYDEVSTGSANELQYPSQDGPVLTATLSDRKKLTKEGAKKDKYEITVQLEGSGSDYEPGDAFYLIVPNVVEEVQWLLRRLNLQRAANKQCAVRLQEGTTRKNAKVPSHLKFVRSIQYIFTNLVDIRRVTSKALLRYLADTCTSSEERRRLLELVSVQGAKEYEQFVRNPGLSILDILHAFPSCAPTVERLLEYLPQLLPRPYSVSSYDPLKNRGNDHVRFVYSQVIVPAGNGRFYHRDGLATSWLTKLAIGSQLRIFLKKPTNFRLLGEHSNCPLILVGAGTGIAPYIGFLERIMEERRQDSARFTNVWLLFGCKNEKLDFLYREELERFQSIGCLSRFHVAFSRDGESSPFRYVQDIINRYGAEITGLVLTESRLRIYVCGEAKSLTNDVFDAFCDILSKHAGKSEVEATEMFRKMKMDGRYVQDVWT